MKKEIIKPFESPRTLDYISAVQVNENGIILIHED